MSLLVLLQEVARAATDLAPIAKLGAALAAGIATIGAAMGISKIGSSALESMARQPEAAGNIQSSMILAAAFVEGVSLFAVVVCLLVAVG
ncbi:MAG: ATP synthase F0 subunit C [Bacteroidales bacterium]|jgi:F-type H+-transporting ATPase subunit c|nr:ATP synthase F0 subunit C [Bacteroidales bacterium]MBQ2498467.1 ATP synthase F0 subunit C [Bacteroidales bacterium]MBQ4205679.1 ATP synthase F0 subunit C [Bacteroidales bacterium]MBQ7533854.1 ATP synthase F0 subunit C [Bacteroidales bacterium]MBR6093287.1 ATP synthase F0 subunit C [Bacteroidales bacterium]